jgi:DNA-directed RNA polymerase sigma subunit (sigma70/sigma32)
MDLMDLIVAGTVGLVRATRRFGPSAYERFTPVAIAQARRKIFAEVA